MNIIIADDHSVVRRGLQQILSAQPAWRIVAEIAKADDVLPVLRTTRADLLILDVALDRRSGIDLLPNIRSEFPSLPVLMLSMYAEEQYALHCLRAGASGYVQKDSAPEQLIEAVRRVATGHTYFSSAVMDQLASEVVRGRAGEPHERLSARELEVFRLIAMGHSVSEIAESLHLSVKTVSTYRARLLEKTGFRSNAEIVAYAIRNRLV
ncbi:MAG TPA: response regulator transcription factor [Thermoanaerobaculia bacterium]|nr:response regulator transcription factor [Thermoanaerobaculia bacterium]